MRISDWSSDVCSSDLPKTAPSPRRWGCLRLAGWCGSRSCGRALALGGFQGRWKGEVESGALAGFGFCPDAAVMARDDPLDAGQADAGAGELGRRMQALEHAEQLVRIGHVQPGAGVAGAKPG